MHTERNIHKHKTNNQLIGEHIPTKRKYAVMFKTFTDSSYIQRKYSSNTFGNTKIMSNRPIRYTNYKIYKNEMRTKCTFFKDENCNFKVKTYIY